MWLEYTKHNSKGVFMNGFNKWFETFLTEKNLPYESWEMESQNGTFNIIDSDVVIEHIKIAPDHEQKAIKEMIVKIDFKNGNVNDFFKHLAGALVQDI
jgi:hypothetical protein